MRKGLPFSPFRRLLPDDASRIRSSKLVEEHNSTHATRSATITDFRDCL
jgi:hypothetical protein